MAGLDSVALARKMAATAPDIMHMSKVVIPGAGKKAASGTFIPFPREQSLP